VESPARAQAHGPALIGLLTRLTGAQSPLAAQPLSERLAGWIDWPQAVALSAALDARAPAGERVTPLVDDECAQLRDTLTAAIAGDRAFVAADAPRVDPAFYRQRYVALQQVMEGEAGLLRKRLRDRLARRATHAALAAIDGVMERALGPRERAALAALPDLLVAHLSRLRDATDVTDADVRAAPWLAQLHHDMRQLLLAELDFRLQPARGLAAALRTNDPEHA
jgi:hypothetical protein